MKTSWWPRAWRNWRWTILASFVGLLLLRTTILDLNRVHSVSMSPSLLPGERILVNRLAYGLKVPFTRCWLLRWGQPARGDVVVFDAPLADKLFVKRIAGLPGDTVTVQNGRLSINGTPVEEQAGQRSYPLLLPEDRAEAPFGPVTVPAGCYFLLGDNRFESRDSRWFGFVERRRILGRACLTISLASPARPSLDNRVGRPAAGTRE